MAFGDLGGALRDAGNSAGQIPDLGPLRDNPKKGKGRGYAGETVESMHRKIRKSRRSGHRNARKAFSHPIKFAPNQPLS